MNGPLNHHCTVVELSGIGVLMEGASGAGKTSLALGLLEAAKSLGQQAFLVADDQANLHKTGGSLVASVPQPIAGRIEIRGFGVTTQQHLDSTVVRIVARMVDDEAIERMPEAKSCRLQGIELPLVAVPCRHEKASIRILMAHIDQLGLNGFN